LVVDTDRASIAESVQHVVQYLLESVHDVEEVA
jgi:hypothetical protein